MVLLGICLEVGNVHADILLKICRVTAPALKIVGHLNDLVGPEVLSFDDVEPAVLEQALC